MSCFKRLAQAVFALLISVCLLPGATASADERILQYHADILVRPDSSMLVTETIRVNTEGREIRRGIYRDFPTTYKDRYGNRYRVTFDILDLLRNNLEEDFHTQDMSNGVRVYMGSADRMLAPGVHEYRLRYHTTRQLGYFEDFDELYWNVTGSDWKFSIDRASAIIELPQAVDADELRLDFYTGRQGATEKNAAANIISDRKIEFYTTSGLKPHENLTIAVGWPKGIVAEPTPSERLAYFLADNNAALVMLAGLLLSLAWYLWAWNKLGRDPRKGIIIPRFEPPKGLTPAGCNYVRGMSFNQQAFAAAVVSLGVKGYVQIEEHDGEFTLYRQDSPANKAASKGELAVMDALFQQGATGQIKLDQENHAEFTKARTALKKALKDEHLGRVFNLNSVYALPAILLTIVAAGIAAVLHAGPLSWIAYAALSVALHLVFLFLMRAPTPAGRRLMDEIEGFRMYLDTAEQSRLEQMRSPDLTPEVFETFLPYAFALGVENKWCDRFARDFPVGQEGRGAYRPHWYVGHGAGLTALHHLGNDFSSGFSSAISSASTPPGSSSGSGGGGFSGGGGGGGGGGGW